MPPHLHRRTPLRQPSPPQPAALLLPPHQPQTSKSATSTKKPQFHLRPPAPRRPVRDPALHRPGPPAHRLQRHRPPPRRPPPLRPPDRQPQPPQTTRCQPQPQNRLIPTPNPIRNRRRDHPRPRTRPPRPRSRIHPWPAPQKPRRNPHGKNAERPRTQTKNQPSHPNSTAKIHHSSRNPGHRSQNQQHKTKKGTGATSARQR